MSTRDSSLCSGWHSRWFVILNELLGEEESLQWVWVLSCENVVDFHLWFVPWVHGILHYVQNGILIDLSFWTSFWARKNPYSECGCWVVNMLLVIIFDSPKEYARFFTMFRMTCQVRFFVILNELLGEEESLQWVWVRSCEHVIGYYLWFTYWVREILHYVQNDMPSAFFCHSERAFWSEEESLQWVWVMSSEHFIGFYLWFA